MRLNIFFVICYLFLAVIAPTKAQIVVSPTVTLFGSLYSYEYLLENIGTTSIVGFGLELPATVVDITTPIGWINTTLPTGSNMLVLWVSSDIPFEVPPSGVLSGFGFTSSAPPGDVLFSTLDENFDGFDGQTRGPVATSPVPEPASLSVLGLGLFGLYPLLRRRR